MGSARRNGVVHGPASPADSTRVRKRLPVAAPKARVVDRRRRRIGPRIVLMCSDLLVVGLCEVVALALIHKAPSEITSPNTWDNVVLGIPLPIVAVLAFSLNGLYKKWPQQLLTSSFTELRDTIYALALAGCVVLAINHFVTPMFGDQNVTFVPDTIVAALLLAAVAVPVGRALVRLWLRAIGFEHCRVLIVGSGMMVRHLLRYLSWDPRITIVGCVDDDPAPGTAVLGRIDQLPAIVEELSVDEVLVSFSRTHPQDAIRRLQSLRSDVAISIVPRYFELLSWRSTVKEIAGLALIDVAPASLSLGARVAKRTFDLVLASMSLVLVTPMLAVAAIAVKASSPGPVLFRQERVGRGGETFKILKLRTMEMGAHDKRAQMAEIHSIDGQLFKMENDPRVTRVGRWLRRLSIDEFPQLVNVLKGEMSLVGPRPFIPEESRHLVGASARRFEVRPGITGLWQVSGRSDLSADELRRLDYLYVASWSPLWDLRILWQTPLQVAKGRGAL